MAIAFVQSTGGKTDTSPLAVTAFGSSVTAGNYIILTLGGDSGATGEVISITDNKGGNTYTQVTGYNAIDGGDNLWIDMWYCKVVNGGTGFAISVTFDDTSTNIAVVAQEFSGIAASTPFDKKATATGTSTTPSSGNTAALSQADELVVGGCVHSGTASAFSLGSGYTNLGQQSVANYQTAQESKVVAATTAVAATFTIAASRLWLCGVATFKGVAGGTAWTQAMSDAMTLTEARVNAPTRKTGDAVTLADAFSKTNVFSRTVAEGVTITDASSKTVGENKTDGVTLSDTVVKSVGFLRTIGDGVTVTDSNAKTVTLTKSDGVTLADTIGKTAEFHRTNDESLTLSDEMSSGVSIVETDSVSLADDVGKSVTSAKGENIAISDEASQSTGFLRQNNESITVSDSMSKTVAALKDESITLTDDRGLVVGKSVADNLALTDAPKKSVAKAITDALAMLDNTVLDVVYGPIGGMRVSAPSRIGAPFRIQAPTRVANPTRVV